MSHESSSAVSTPADATPPSGGVVWRPWAVAIGAVAFAALAVALLRPGGRTAAEVPSPFAVDGDRIVLGATAPTWHYLDFARAEVQPPVAPAAVPGRVAFDESRAAPLVAPLPGRVDAVSVRLGERVTRGDRLIAVRSRDLIDLTKEIELKRAEENAKAKTAERLRALVELRAEPSKKLIDAEQELAQAQLARQGAELKLRSLSVANDAAGLYWLLAPRDGVVVQRNVLVGQEVGPDRSDPLMVVAELDEVIVSADVPEADVAGLTVGEPATVVPATAGAQPLLGRTEYVGEVIDPERRMVEVRVRAPNPGGTLRPNAFVQVSFAAGGDAQVVVPAEAVVTDDQQSFVFVRGAGDALQRREVALGRQRAGQVEIVRGLSPGETYVTKGALLLLNAVDLAAQ